jgi:hypothetical protein
MTNAIKAWTWSLGVVARSFRTVIVLAVLTALWVFAAYGWLGLAESSALLLMLAFIWAIVQVMVAVIIVGGTVSAAAEGAATAARGFPARSIWTKGRKTIGTTLVFFLVSFALVWVCSTIFDWINGHSVEVASFLTFHSPKPVSHILIEEIYSVIEAILGLVLAGFLLSFFIALVRGGWREAAKQSGKLLAGCAFQMPFLTNLLSVAVFGGGAYQLANSHPIVPEGFWDYTQMIVRLSLVVLLLSAGIMFWSLSLARLQAPKEATQ